MVDTNQFFNFSHKDPNQHLWMFVKLYGIFKLVVKLKLFPFYPFGRALDWLDGLPYKFIIAWN